MSNNYTFHLFTLVIYEFHVYITVTINSPQCLKSQKNMKKMKTDFY